MRVHPPSAGLRMQPVNTDAHLPEAAPPRPGPPEGGAREWGVAAVFLWFLIGGIAHFCATAVEMRIVPPFVPWPRAAVLASGAFELVGAAGLLVAPARRAAGVGLLLLTVAVTPAHIYMLQQPERFAVPYGLLVARLPLQLALLALIYWSAVAPAAPVPLASGSMPDPGRR
jgi:uncharacterized membrane protein